MQLFSINILRTSFVSLANYNACKEEEEEEKKTPVNNGLLLQQIRSFNLEKKKKIPNELEILP